jgi:AraC-like DNA-binding protein
MQNIYETLRSTLYFNKFEVGELLFVEYRCPIEEENLGLWSQYDYLIHVLSGQKTWRTTRGTWTVSAGQTIFFKKGAAIINQHFDDDFCMLGFFISDEFVRDTLKEFSGKIEIHTIENNPDKLAIEVDNDAILSTYFQSMLTHFSNPEKPTNEILLLKMKELVLNLFSGRKNPELSSYLRSLSGEVKPSIQKIMDANFSYNLTLEEYAKLCHRSLSSFKRDFKKHFNITPGKWLQLKRLEYSALLLKNNELSISQIAFDSGFEDLSHFSRAFKNKFGIPPNKFRNEIAA